jgi:TRAP transporter 4TM/12TM fusion protein
MLTSLPGSGSEGAARGFMRQSGTTVVAESAESDGGNRRTRELSGPLGIVVRAVSIGLSVYVAIYISTVLRIFDISLYGAHRALAYSFILFLLFMLYPASAKGPWNRVPWYDFVLAAVGIFTSFYAFLSWNEWLEGVGLPTALEEFYGIALVLVTLEGSRRVLGPGFTIVGLVFIVYPLIGPYLPGVLVTRHYTISTLVQNFYFAGTSSGIFGSAMEIFTTTVAMFLVFGAFLQVSGAAQVFLDMAMGLAGRFRGGMAKVAVIASAFFGTISGVGVANVLVTGSFTIPAMKRMGYRPALAGAVEAAAGTGGILVPPVVGAAAFLMSDILGIPYWDIAVAALIPAVLYYLALFVIVDFEGARDGIKGVPREEIPSLGKTLLHGWYLLFAIAVLLILLGTFGVPVDQSALAALVVLIVLSTCRRGGLRWQGMLQALDQGGRTMAEIGSAGAVVGIIIGGFSLTGLGAVLPQSMQALAGNNLFILLVLAALAATILGMGAPPLLVYVLLVTSVAPAIIKMGVSPLAAHMFVFYFGLLSMLTPPVALCAMIAARVAGANFWLTAMEACRLAVVAYIVPFFFVYQPVLLFKGDAIALLSAFMTAVIGVVALSGALTRYFFFRQLPLWEACLTGTGGLLLLYPGWMTDIAGLLLIIPTTGITFFMLARQRRARPA